MNGDPVDWAKGAGFIVSVAAAIAILWKAGQTIVRVVTGVIRTLYNLPDYLSNIAHASSLSKANTEILLERLSVARWDADTSGAITDVNRVLTKLTGWTLDDVAGNGWKNMIHPDDIERVEFAFTRTIKERIPYDIELRWMTRWGTVIHGRGTARWERNGRDYLAGAFEPTVTTLTELQADMMDIKHNSLSLQGQLTNMNAKMDSAERASDSTHRSLYDAIQMLRGDWERAKGIGDHEKLKAEGT